MKRFENKEIEKQLEGFKEKLSLKCFSERYCILKKYSGGISWEEKKGGGDMETAYSEITVLHQLGWHYNVSYLQWTGDQREGKNHDGILYFNGDKKKVEISALMDEKEMRDFRNQNYSEREFIIEDSIGTNEESNQEILGDGTVNSKIFIYNRILKIFTKKNREQYNGYWLCIPYNPFSMLGEFNSANVKNYIFEKIKNEEKNLLYSIGNIFEKIIFLPYYQNDKIFEWYIK